MSDKTGPEIIAQCETGIANAVSRNPAKTALNPAFITLPAILLTAINTLL
jgi:hypothetical protein